MDYAAETCSACNTARVTTQSEQGAVIRQQQDCNKSVACNAHSVVKTGCAAAALKEEVTHQICKRNKGNLCTLQGCMHMCSKGCHSPQKSGIGKAGLWEDIRCLAEQIVI